MAAAPAGFASAIIDGAPKMADIARSLGLSARSFHRRLSEHGMSFQTLTEETRRELAEETGITTIEFRWGERYFETGPYSRGKTARYYLAATEEQKGST